MDMRNTVLRIASITLLASGAIAATLAYALFWVSCYTRSMACSGRLLVILPVKTRMVSAYVDCVRIDFAPPGPSDSHDEPRFVVYSWLGRLCIDRVCAIESDSLADIRLWRSRELVERRYREGAKLHGVSGLAGAWLSAVVAVVFTAIGVRFVALARRAVTRRRGNGCRGGELPAPVLRTDVTRELGQ